MFIRWQPAVSWSHECTTLGSDDHASLPVVMLNVVSFERPLLVVTALAPCPMWLGGDRLIGSANLNVVSLHVLQAFLCSALFLSRPILKRLMLAAEKSSTAKPHRRP
eukprot:TRINITY_DN114705_c0_g1_i1.p1 TRINITY_DN114705_c0_g1~~TRINITY_DN114705_c0_g1_i1.p1  ORF type:complete len:107 (-),score=7.39 TRINITY_DN114705_c0_g1_i1:29-349(-)